MESEENKSILSLRKSDSQLIRWAKLNYNKYKIRDFSLLDLGIKFVDKNDLEVLGIEMIKDDK